MSEALFVHYERQLIGQLTPLNSGQMEFRYHEAWAHSPSAFPISISLPLDGTFSPSARHHYFANLLPEANVRQQICRSLGISNANDFQLLKAIGGDCAGALTITSQQQLDPTPLRPRYEPISDEQLAQWSVGTPDAFSAITGQNEVRLSLAGAQDKLPVHLEGENVFIPVGGTPSTYLLKFASPFYSHLPENETFVSLLARAVDLPVVEVGLRHTAKARIAVIARYDRIGDRPKLSPNNQVSGSSGEQTARAGEYRRVHQEDFCQALGIGPLQKYEKEGGPGLKRCADVIRQHTSFPLIELQKLLRWTIFNLLVGNADAHGKNLSLLYNPEGGLSLAPFYDLVCTRNYKKISRHLAMHIGGVYDPDLIGTPQLHLLALDLGVRPAVVIKAAHDLIQTTQEAIAPTINEFVQRFGTSPVTLRLPIIIRKQIRRLKTLLK